MKPAPQDNKITKPEDLLKDIEAQDEEFDVRDLPIKKRIFYAAMIRSFGNITQSCIVAGIKRSTFRRWMKEDHDFRKLMDEGDFEERLLDFAESKLISKIEQGDIIGTIFFLKTRGKKRGYIEGNGPPPAGDPNKTPSWFDSPRLPAPDNSPIQDAEIIEDNGSDTGKDTLDQKTA